jgi:poly(3-hydroxybutyrate) depolymerase
MTVLPAGPRAERRTSRPDGLDLLALLPGPLNQCWRFYYPPAWTRGHSAAAASAEMTRTVIGKLAIDLEHVHNVDVSAGGLMASVEAAPDPCAAAGRVIGIGLTGLAQLAVAAGAGPIANALVHSAPRIGWRDALRMRSRAS